jgi:hypothetical protein
VGIVRYLVGDIILGVAVYLGVCLVTVRRIPPLLRLLEGVISFLRFSAY